MKITKTEITKNPRDGRRAELTIDSPELGNRSLKVTICKRCNGKLCSDATVGEITHNGKMFTYSPFSDFYLNLGCAERNTVKNVQLLLDQAEAQAAELLQTAVQFYAAKVKTI